VARRPLTSAWTLPAFAVLVSLLAIPGVFTLSKVFFVRDLATFFRPHHLWFRQTLLGGSLPFWNPYAGCGYSTSDDPALQTFFPLTLPLRLLPATLGFNLLVALPIAVAALGMHRFLRRIVSPQAAGLGAIVFAASGPLLSTANMPNLAWSCALMPWVLGAVQALVESWTWRRAAVLSATFALMLLAGEPVTFVATACLALAYALTFGSGVRARLLATVAGASAFSALLAAIQVLPTAMITSGSIRSTGALRDMWSLHPARLVEAVAPFLYGRYTGFPHEITQWLFVFNDAREPLLFSIYLGVPALLVAAIGASLFGRSRAATFWVLAGLVALVAASTRMPIPLFRFPSKYVVLTALAVAALTAIGWDALRERRRLAAPMGAAALLVVVSAVGLVLVHVAPETGRSVATRVATSVGVPQVDSGAASLLAAVGGAAPRILLVTALGGVLLWLAHRGTRAAAIALYLVIAGDLVVANAPINPTVDASVLEPFDWVRVTNEHREDRVFVARDYLHEPGRPPDVAPPPVFPPDRPVVVYQAVYETALGTDLSAEAVPQTLSRELTGLRPREYLSLLRAFRESDRVLRDRFLSWAGTRYFLTMSHPAVPSEERARLPIGSLALYESATPGSRAFVVTRAVVEPDPQAQIARIFDPAFDPFSTVVLDREPPAPASAGPGAAAGATIRSSTSTSVVVDASVPDEGGYLVLIDSFDRGWKVEVDGRKAELLRADGAFRAVRLAAGTHVVGFRYVPRALLLGAATSLVATVLLAIVALKGSDRSP
jgi:membrane protein YfhO